MMDLLAYQNKTKRNETQDINNNSHAYAFTEPFYWLMFETKNHKMSETKTEQNQTKRERKREQPLEWENKCLSMCHNHC